MTRIRLPDSPKIAFLHGTFPDAKKTYARLIERYGSVPPEEADVIVALGGDGWLLQVLHQYMNSGKPIYGMNRGSVGFLMNSYCEDTLIEKLLTSHTSVIHPLLIRATDEFGVVHEAHAINEVSLIRASAQAAKIRIHVNGQVRLDELVCDGVLVATPAGSTAYNFSAQGPILPIDSEMLALTPICAFRPRRWRGALLPNHAQVALDVLKAERRPVHVACDNKEFHNIVKVDIELDHASNCILLFDPDHSLEERILREQFVY